MIKNILTRRRSLRSVQLWLVTAGIVLGTGLVTTTAMACDCDGKKGSSCEEGKECGCKKHKGKKSCKHCKHDSNEKAADTKPAEATAPAEASQ